MTQKLRCSLLIGFLSLGLVACSAGPEDGTDLDTDIGVQPQQGALAVAAGERYIVTFNDYTRQKAHLEAIGATVAIAVARELPAHGAVAAYMPASAAQALSRSPDVAYVELDPVREPLGQTTPYGITMVQATDPTFSNACGTVKLCIIDSGLYTGHADFSGLPVTGSVGNLPWNEDGCGHGTHVAGTIAAVNNNIGVVGAAPNSVSLHIVRVFGDSCSWAYASDLVAALDECEAAGAKVVSMSLGGGTPSTTEDQAFASADNAGILSIAAAGNAGSTMVSYPAGYESVVSVGAIDQRKVLASFSQRNSDVELTAPGVGVLSTVPWSTPTLTVGAKSHNGLLIAGTAEKNVSGVLVDGGLCNAIGAWKGKVVLCERGGATFADKVAHVKDGDGSAAAIYNNVPGLFVGLLGPGGSSTIPAITLSQEDGKALLAPRSLGQRASLNVVKMAPGSGYDVFSGTSMAAPHVSAVAALIWSFTPWRTNAQVRAALTATAEDLGATGRDDSFGFGLVQAKAALTYLQSLP